MSGEVYNVSDIYNDVKREGEIVLGREMTEQEITETCKAMLSDFTDQLWESGYFDSPTYSDEDLQADKDLFNENFVDNLKETLPKVLDGIEEDKSNKEKGLSDNTNNTSHDDRNSLPSISTDKIAVEKFEAQRDLDDKNDELHSLETPKVKQESVDRDRRIAERENRRKHKSRDYDGDR